MRFQISLKPKIDDEGCPVAPTTRLSQTRRYTYSTFIQPDTLAITIVLLVPNPTLPQTVLIAGHQEIIPTGVMITLAYVRESRDLGQDELCKF
jgi:hypothetical protein